MDHRTKRWYKLAVKAQEEICPFDIISRRVVRNDIGTFWFKTAGENTQENGLPILENLHRIDGPAATYNYRTKKRLWAVNGDVMSKELFYAKFGVITLKDLTSGKVSHNHNGTFYFKEPGNNVDEDGKPIIENLHRLDGPAVIWPNGVMESYINGVKYTAREFKKRIKCLQNP